jgi:hypothetical protein
MRAATLGWRPFDFATRAGVATVRFQRRGQSTARSDCRLVNLPHILLNGAHERLAASLPAIIFDCSFVVREPLKIEYGLASRCQKIAAYPRGDHFPPRGIRT